MEKDSFQRKFEREKRKIGRDIYKLSLYSGHNFKLGEQERRRDVKDYWRKESRRGNDLNLIIDYASRIGLSVRVVTNGYWAKSPEIAKEKLLELSKCGLKEVNFSTGEDHQEWVSYDNIVYGSIAALDLGLTCVINVESHDKSKFKSNLFYEDERLKKYLDINNKNNSSDLVDAVAKKSVNNSNSTEKTDIDNGNFETMNSLMNNSQSAQMEGIDDLSQEEVNPTLNTEKYPDNSPLDEYSEFIPSELEYGNTDYGFDSQLDKYNSIEEIDSYINKDEAVLIFVSDNINAQVRSNNIEIDATKRTTVNDYYNRLIGAVDTVNIDTISSVIPTENGTYNPGDSSMYIGIFKSIPSIDAIEGNIALIKETDSDNYKEYIYTSGEWKERQKDSNTTDDFILN